MGGKLPVQDGGQYDYAFFHRMTPAAAAAYLQSGQVVPRDLGTALREMYPHPDLQDRLASAFASDGDPHSPAVRKKVRNWLNSRNYPASREDLFRVAFALNLSESQANSLLGLCTDYGIHYRDGRDVVYAWFLRTGRSYCQAKAFWASLPAAAGPREPPPAGAGIHLTRELLVTFQWIQSEEELRAAYRANLPRFGALHLRAYAYFDKYFTQLSQPSPEWNGRQEPGYSVETVMERYLSMHVPSERRRTSYSALQKLVKRNWPNATILRNICTRRADVPRKLLLLLYVVTENVFDGSYQEVDEAYIKSRERFEDHRWALNAILTDCGMPALDPRNPTDWLVLYALTAGDEPMSERMEQVIRRIYPES